MARIVSAIGSGNAEDFLRVLQEALNENLYSKDPNSNLYQIHKVLSTQLAEIDAEIQAIKSDNVIEVIVNNESKIRKLEQQDRLIRQGAFELLNVRFTAPGTIRNEVVSLTEGQESLNLKYKPEIEDEIVVKDREGATIDIIEYNEKENKISFSPITYSGQYTLTYTDRGVTLTSSEKITLPEILSLLGYGESPYGEFGFGI